MLEAMKALAERSVMERVVLLVNHVISAEPVAMERLKANAARTIRIEFEGWPALLPTPGPLAFRITPPGLVEWIDEPGPMTPDLRVAIEVPNPALALARLVVGERPAISVDGNAAFASDVNWLIENLRWDIQDDLARIVGDAPARELGRFGNAVAKALREGAKKLDAFARRAEPSGERPAAEPPPR
jgi:ubiquinone biosynthesis accessory factor UbiJ